MRTLKKLAVVIAITIITSFANADTWFVDASATTNGNGDSWTTAFNNLTSALNNPLMFPGDDVWVANGTYKPTSQSASFILRPGVRVLGGFTGGETLETERNHNPVTNGCIISGDLNGNDGPDFANYGDNCHHVVVGEDLDSSAVLDGFTIGGGNATAVEDGGGALLLTSSTPRVSSCRFLANRGHLGGAVRLQETEAADQVADFRNCSFEGNLARLGLASGEGGAIFIDRAANIVSSRFVANLTQAGGAGGAIRHNGSGITNVYNCVLIGNHADGAGSRGGAISANTESEATLYVVNCLIVDNYAKGFGGVIHTDGQVNLQVSVSTIADNGVDGIGGAMFLSDDGLAYVRNSIIWNNFDNFDNQFGGDTNSATINHSDIQDGWNGAGGGNIDADPLFVGSGDYLLACGSPCIDAGDDILPPDLVLLNPPPGEPDDPIQYDLVLNARINGVHVDMGAYEVHDSCPGDADGNCVVDVDDLVSVILQWGCTNPPCTADVSPSPCGDGDVNVDDLIAVILGWGACGNCTESGTGAGADPESYEDCEAMCEGLEGEVWVTAMQRCFYHLCTEKNMTEFCED